MRKIIILAVSLIISLTVFAQESRTYQFTLEECLEYALQNSYGRQSIKLSEDLNEETYKLSKQLRLPGLSASLSESFSHHHGESGAWGGNYGLSTSITLFQGLNIHNTIKQNKLISEQSKYRTTQYDNELKIQILQSFLSVLGNEELLRLQQQLLVATEEQLKQGEEQLRAGQILESDFLLLQAQYATEKDNIVDSEISIENSILALKNLLSMDPGSTLEIVYPDTSVINLLLALPSREEVLTKAFATMPDLQISLYEIDIANLNVDLAKSAYYPNIGLSGGIATGHVVNYKDFGRQLADQFNQQVSLSINIPIYNRGQTKTRVMQNRILLQQAELDRLNTELNIRQVVIQEYQNVVSANSKYQAANVKQNAYYKTFEAYRARFNLGDVTPVDLLQQQNNYISALNEYIQGKYSFLLRRKILDVYMGEEIKM